MADSENQQAISQTVTPQQKPDSENQQAISQTDTTQQVTSQKPATKQKNPNRVRAGKATAVKTKMAREAQKKAFIEAQSIIANNQVKHDSPPPAETPSPPADTESTKNVLTTTQLLSVISIVVSLAAIYYKREEIKVLLTKKPPLTPPPAPPNSPVLPRYSRGIQPMD